MIYEEAQMSMLYLSEYKAYNGRRGEVVVGGVAGF
jgi:hypothetical protein